MKELEDIKLAAKILRTSSTKQRNSVLKLSSQLLLKEINAILKANNEDLMALESSATPAFKDRLLLDEKRITQMAESLNQVAELTDPLNEEADKKILKNGLILRRIRSPLGVIFLIFESRPNVSTEAFSLAIKSGNTLILRGGKESMRTTQAIYKILSQALEENGLPKSCFWGINNPDKNLVKTLLLQKKYIDVVVPRGGEGLIQFVVENSEIPIIKNDRGMCHTYVHDDADIEMALRIIVNAKTQRPGVCNALETVLVNATIQKEFLPKLYDAMKGYQVEWHVCPETMNTLKDKDNVVLAVEKSWDTEYLDYKINCRIVKSLDDAILHIEEHGSHHSECIVTSSETTAKKFQSEVDAAVVYHNASTRFTDGFEFGLGGELGISTQKLHVRGPVGLKELTSLRWIVEGNGQVR